MNLKLETKKLAAKLGFRIVRMGDDERVPPVPFDEFSALLLAYETLLNQRHPSAAQIPPNEQRLRLLGQLLGTPVPEAYAIIQAIAATADVPGDVCELGVAQGATSVLIANEIALTGKALHLFDSFEGLPAPTSADTLKDDPEHLGSIEAYAGMWAYPRDLVVARLRAIGFPDARVHIHEGFVDAILAAGDGLPETVSCAYLDFDFYEPIRDGLAFLDGVISPGGIIAVDDYDFFSTGVKRAVDEFLDARAASYELDVADPVFGHYATLRRLD